MRKDSFVAATRFGMGARPNEVSYIESSPKGWLQAQLKQPQPLPAAYANLPGTKDNLATLANSKKAAKDITDKEQRKAQEKPAKQEVRQGFGHEMAYRAWFASTTNTPFIERLVDFWSNHFAVSVQKGDVIALAGPMEREAIRPNLLGNFRDMLMAVSHHPAMLVYLDQAQSVGPNSLAGTKNSKGLNENLAREIMELHTLGVNGGYSQADVTSFARVLTGWSIDRAGEQPTQVVKGGRGLLGLGATRNPIAPSAGNNGFAFYPGRHEPGAQTIMGKTYAGKGEDQGIAVLTDLAASPATAVHLATKLARHFVADQPPQSAIDALAHAYTASGGNLMEVYQALINLPEAWEMKEFKIKSSYDLVISASRVTGVTPTVEWFIQSFRFLGNFPFSATSPAGYPDTAQDLAGPEAVLRRVEWAKSAATHLPSNEDFRAIAERAIGPIASTATTASFTSAHTNQEGLTLVLASPEFQKR